jgi:hypothetical protein
MKALKYLAAATLLFCATACSSDSTSTSGSKDSSAPVATKPAEQAPVSTSSRPTTVDTVNTADSTKTNAPQ